MLNHVSMVKVFMTFLEPGRREKKGHCAGFSAVGVASGRPKPDERKKGRDEKAISFSIAQTNPGVSDLSIALDSWSEFFSP